MREFEIVNNKIKPDDAGQLGGVRIENRNGKRIVKMSDNQAKWYLESGQIALVETVTSVAPKNIGNK